MRLREVNENCSTLGHDLAAGEHESRHLPHRILRSDAITRQFFDPRRTFDELIRNTQQCERSLDCD